MEQLIRGPLAQLVERPGHAGKVNGLMEQLIRGPLAQLVERFHGMEEVNGSIPLGSTIKTIPNPGVVFCDGLWNGDSAMPCVYILFSEKTNRYYIGSTNDFSRRLLEHDRGQTFSTRTGAPWKTCFVHETPRAKSIEAHLKRQKSRSLLERIVLTQCLPEGV